jgi:DNA mismatch repair protein MutL
MINILPPEEAKKIAAGEVIDRPAALVREFIDKALDSLALNIELSIERGGVNKVEVIDDGSGMSREDLALCVENHATSKIQSLDDLSRTVTLGFRGEALSAAAASARLEILSSTDGREAWLLESPGMTLTQTRRTKGTSVRAYGLFDAIPARKRFLKRETGEAAFCRQTFIEKALAFPGVSFRFVQDGIVKLQLFPCIPAADAAGTNTGSICAAGMLKRFGELFFRSGQRNFLHTIETGGKGFTVTIIFGGPELYRQDRRQQYIYVNKRRIQDYGLMQALEYGLSGYFPNNSHPAGAVFVEVDPALVDFNIHPAKREIRFADAAAIHHCITSALRGHVQKAVPWTGERENAAPYARSLAMEALLERRDDFAPLPQRTGQVSDLPSPAGERRAGLTGADAVAEPEPVYYTGSMDGKNTKVAQQLRLIGRAFGLFIVAEKGNRLFLIDQHAAHERILYNHFLSTPIAAQELLVEIPLAVSSAEEENFLCARQEELKRLGIVLESGGSGGWRITALPAGWKAGDGETADDLLCRRTAGKDMAERWAAALACRAAIKDGGWLDDEAALALAEAALALEKETGQLPRCPHGRPLWTEITREELFRAVRRIE